MARELECPNCGNCWTTKSESDRVSCSKCGRKVNTKSGSKEPVSVKARARSGGSVKVRAHARGTTESKDMDIMDVEPLYRSKKGKQEPAFEELVQQYKQKGELEAMREAAKQEAQNRVESKRAKQEQEEADHRRWAMLQDPDYLDKDTERFKAIVDDRIKFEQSMNELNSQLIAEYYEQQAEAKREKQARIAREWEEVHAKAARAERAMNGIEELENQKREAFSKKLRDAAQDMEYKRMALQIISADDRRKRQAQIEQMNSCCYCPRCHLPFADKYKCPECNSVLVKTAIW